MSSLSIDIPDGQPFEDAPDLSEKDALFRAMNPSAYEPELIGRQIAEIECGRTFTALYPEEVGCLARETAIGTEIQRSVFAAVTRFQISGDPLRSLSERARKGLWKVEEVLLEDGEALGIALPEGWRDAFQELQRVGGERALGWLPPYYTLDDVWELVTVIEESEGSMGETIGALRVGSPIGDLRQMLDFSERVSSLFGFTMGGDDFDKLVPLGSIYRRNLEEKVAELIDLVTTDLPEFLFSLPLDLVEERFDELAAFIEIYGDGAVFFMKGCRNEVLEMEREHGDLLKRIVAIYREDDREDHTLKAFSGLTNDLLKHRPALDRLLEQKRSRFHEILGDNLLGYLERSDHDTFEIVMPLEGVEPFEGVVKATDNTPTGAYQHIARKYAIVSAWNIDEGLRVLQETPVASNPFVLEGIIARYGAAAHGVIGGLGEMVLEREEDFREIALARIGEMGSHSAARFFLAVPPALWDSHGKDFGARFAEGAFGMHELWRETDTNAYKNLLEMAPYFTERMGIRNFDRYVQVRENGTLDLSLLHRLGDVWEGRDLSGDSASMFLIARKDWNRAFSTPHTFDVLKAVIDEGGDPLVFEVDDKVELLTAAMRGDRQFRSIDSEYQGVRLMGIYSHSGITGIQVTPENVRGELRLTGPGHAADKRILRKLTEIAHPDGAHYLFNACSAGAGGETGYNFAAVMMGYDPASGASAPRRPGKLTGIAFDPWGSKQVMRAEYDLPREQVLERLNHKG